MKSSVKSLRNGTLSKFRQKLLRKLPYIELSPMALAWSLRYAEILKFHRKFGHIDVPKSHKRLHNWLRNQINYIRSSSNQLSEKHKRQLIQLNPKLSKTVASRLDVHKRGRPPGAISKQKLGRTKYWENIFDDRMREFAEFRKSDPQFYPSSGSSNPTNRKLASYFRSLRIKFDGGKMAPSRIKKLKELGVPWVFVTDNNSHRSPNHSNRNDDGDRDFLVIS